MMHFCSIVCLLFLFLAVSVRARTLFVNSVTGSDGNNNNACDVAAAPCKTLQRAVSVAQPQDEVLAQGSFSLAQTLQLTAALSFRPLNASFDVSCAAGVTSAFSVEGANGVSFSGVFFSGCSDYAVRTLQSTVVIDQCDFESPGGAIRASQSSVSIQSSTVSGSTQVSMLVDSSSIVTLQSTQFVGNRGQQGGAISVSNAQVTLIGITFSNNRAALSGGALLARQNSNITARSVVCDNNIAGLSGGCFHLESSYLRLSQNSGLRNNAAIQYGGAIAGMFGASIEVVDSIFTGNNATNGGAVGANTAQSVTLQRSEFNQNGASAAGGAIYVFSVGTLSMTSVQVVGNLASNDGGGLSLTNTVVQSSGLTVRGNIAFLGRGGAFFMVEGSFTGFDVHLSQNNVGRIGQGAGGYALQGGFALNNLTISDNTFIDGSGIEGLVCMESNGFVSGATLQPLSVVCGLKCRLTANGNNNVCATQPTGGADPIASAVDAEDVSAVVGAVTTVEVSANNAYDVPVNVVAGSDMTAYLQKGTLHLLNPVDIKSSGQTGVYILSFKPPYAGDLTLNVLMSGTQITNSPVGIHVKADSSTDLTGLWVVMGLLGGLGLVIGGVFLYRHYVKRLSYQPLTDQASKSRSYGGGGFQSTDTEEI
jgi:predicted outer membrane repeat protein